jgi:hypothetical protein
VPRPSPLNSGACTAQSPQGRFNRISEERHFRSLSRIGGKWPGPYSSMRAPSSTIRLGGRRKNSVASAALCCIQAKSLRSSGFNRRRPVPKATTDTRERKKLVCIQSNPCPPIEFSLEVDHAGVLQALSTLHNVRAAPANNCCSCSRSGTLAQGDSASLYAKGD